MLLTTTNDALGKEIVEYKGLVSGDVAAGINFLKDIGAGLRNIIGGRSAGYEDEIGNARKEAISEMVARAEQMGANAVIGLKIDYETMGANGSMIYVVATGTAVVIK